MFSINISYFCIMKRNIDFFYKTFCLITGIFSLLAANASAEGSAPTLSSIDSLEVSLLTCEPHEEVYSLYGHTAIRIYSASSGEDLAVNYGVFDSSDPAFVPHFVFGMTDYTMSIIPMNTFLREYDYYGCAVREQVLNLTAYEKAMLVGAIFQNYEPANRKYRYNFFYNNCTTKARDIIVSALQGNVEYHPTKMQEGEWSFRELIHWKNEDYPWAAFGNDILLGYKADRNTDRGEREFLPEVLMADFDSAYIVNEDGNTRPLIKDSRWILKTKPSMLEPMTSFPLRPSYIFAILLLTTICVSFSEFRDRKQPSLRTRRFVGAFDLALFSACGIAGIVITAMLFSEHPTVNENLQILLLNPLWLAYCPLRRKYPVISRIAAALVLLFFAGAAFQTYAEGMLILACCLCIRIISHVRQIRAVNS